MTLRAFSTLAVAFSCLGTALPANAWVEAESENFILTGDLRKGDAKDVLRSLEGYRANFLRLVQAKGGTEDIKVKIYTVPNENMVDAIAGRRDASGLYTTNIEGPIFLLNTESGFRNAEGSRRAGSNMRKGTKRDDKKALRIAYHEYAHHLMVAYTEAHYPLWYNEGFAEFLASYEASKGKFSVGKASFNHASWLEYGNWLPTDYILKAVRDYPYEPGSKVQSQFYAQTWLMVHYLQNTPGMSAKANAYMAGLNRGADPIESFEGTMGMSVDAFESAVRAYYKSGRLLITSFETPVNPKAVDVQVRDMSEAEGELALLDAAYRFGPTETAVNWSERIAGQSGAKPDYHLLQARIAMDAKTPGEARTHIAQALGLAPTDANVLRAAAAVESMAYQEGAGGTLVQAREYAQQVLDKAPNDPEANYIYALTFGPGTSDASALRAARTALGYYRDMRFASTNLSLMDMLIQGGQKDGLKRRLLLSSVWARNAGARRAAKQMADRL